MSMLCAFGRGKILYAIPANKDDANGFSPALTA